MTRRRRSAVASQGLASQLGPDGLDQVGLCGLGMPELEGGQNFKLSASAVRAVDRLPPCRAGAAASHARGRPVDAVGLAAGGGLADAKRRSPLAKDDHGTRRDEESSLVAAELNSRRIRPRQVGAFEDGAGTVLAG